MADEYLMVTPRPLTRQDLVDALETLGEPVSVSLTEDGRLSTITAENDALLCRISSSLHLRLPALDGYGTVPEGMGFCSTVVLHPAAGAAELDQARQIAAQLGGTLLDRALDPAWTGGAAGSGAPPSSGSGESARTGWRPARSALPVRSGSLRRMTYAEADAAYGLRTLPPASITADPSILLDAASSPSTTDRIGLVTALLDRGADAGCTGADGRSVLHVLCGVLREHVELHLPLIERLIDEGADPGIRDPQLGTPLEVLAHNRHLPREEAAMLRDVLVRRGAGAPAPTEHGHGP